MKCITNLFKRIEERKQKKEAEKKRLLELKEAQDKRKLECQKARYSKDPELLEIAKKYVYASRASDVQCIPFTIEENYSDSKDLSQNAGYSMNVRKEWTVTTKGIDIYVDDKLSKRHVISTEEGVTYQDADYQ